MDNLENFQDLAHTAKTGICARTSISAVVYKRFLIFFINCLNLMPSNVSVNGICSGEVGIQSNWLKNLIFANSDRRSDLNLSISKPNSYGLIKIEFQSKGIL